MAVLSSAFIIHSCSSFSSHASAESANRLKGITPITIQLTNYFWGEANQQFSWSRNFTLFEVRQGILPSSQKTTEAGGPL